LEQLREAEIERKRLVGKLLTFSLNHLTQEFLHHEFEWLLPVVFCKSTDPLWPDPGASIEKRIELEIYGETVRATSSMIVHKMVACSLAHPKLFALSPNIRVERRERAETGKHLYEFTQLDFEVRDASSDEIRSFVEKVICGLVEEMRERRREELNALGRSPRIPETPFAVYDREELEEKYGKEWEERLVSEITHPVWVTNIPREFYDFQDGKWDNYDLILPQYGEVLSGGRREWEYERIVRKMERDGVRKENYTPLLKLAEEGKLKPSAGAGIGVERLVGWVAGVQHVGEVQLFPKIPGVVYDL
jgi:asparaginyl-tRNA synthetase